MWQHEKKPIRNKKLDSLSTKLPALNEFRNLW